MNDTSVTLAQAFRFVESGELAKARSLLEPLRDKLSNSADYWWVYAHALEDDSQGREALQRVYNLDRDYPGIASLADELGLVSSAAHKERPVPSTSLEPEDLSVLVGKRRDSGGSRLRRLLTPFALLLLIALGIGLLLPRLNQPATTTLPTATGQDESAVIAGIPTEPTASTEIIASEEPSATAPEVTLTSESSDITEEPDLIVSSTDTPETAATMEPSSTGTPEVAETSTVDTIDATPTMEAVLAQSVDLDTLFEPFDLPEQGARIEQTLLGTTLVVDTCSVPGPQASSTIAGIAQVLNANPESLPTDVEGLAIRVVDCSAGTVFRVVGITRDALLSQDMRDIQAALQPID